MITFSDQQLAVLMRVAGNLPLDKRAAFFERASITLVSAALATAISSATRGHCVGIFRTAT
jgi:hypothetical protein